MIETANSWPLSVRSAQYLSMIAVLLLLTSCYDSGFSQRGNDDTTPAPISYSIHELREIYEGKTFQITSDVFVSGRVNTSDLTGNFYRTLCIQEGGAGLEIMAGIDHLHNDFPEGCHVTLSLKGLAVGESYGILQVGCMPAPGSGYVTDYLGSKPALDGALTRNGIKLEPQEPVLLTIPELTYGICGTLVRIEGLQYTPDDLTAGTWAGYKRFTDAEGAEIYTYVRNYAGFAGKEVPFVQCTLTGILQRSASGDRYMLKLRDENDCAN